MTRKLTEDEKKKRKEERRVRKQQKPKSPTVRTIQQPQEEAAAPGPAAASLCDGCLYEPATCEVLAEERGHDEKGNVASCHQFEPGRKEETVISPPEPEEDWGTCTSCSKPLKRTAFNRARDAIRCTNPRCGLYREVIRSVTRKPRTLKERGIYVEPKAKQNNNSETAIGASDNSGSETLWDGGENPSSD